MPVIEDLGSVAAYLRASDECNSDRQLSFHSARKFSGIDVLLFFKT